ncbi:MAG: metal-dependent hydrolase [Bryobacteraceae bacterium]|nr:metal-dependent hydrolase [Bryobacteraceae bacterium]MDW8379167.1 metal-dependent hydrolase [Bryobacterales bacterium]
MDNLTHSLLGWTLSRAGLRPWCSQATAVLVVAANLPDADLVTLVGGPLAYLDHHRGLSHSLMASPLVGAAAAAIVRLFSKGPWSWARSMLCGWLGVLSHLLLDWTNVYGIRLLVPFRSDWCRLDSTFIIDVWLWAALLFGLAAGALSRLVSSEIGAKAGPGRGPAIAVLLFVVLYEYGRLLLHARAVNTLDSHVYAGAPAVRVTALPDPINPFAWTGIVETRDFTSIYAVNLLTRFDPETGKRYDPPRPGPAFEAAKRHPTVRGFLQFSQLPLWQVTPVDRPEGAVKVSVFDLRFGTPGSSRFFVSVLVDRNNQVVREDFSFGWLRAR